MNTRLTPFQIASAYIGVTIGAGFASGQEILQFFSFFGPASFAAIVLTAFLFYFFSVVILKIGYELNANSYLEVVYKSGGRLIGMALDAVITFFLFGSFVAMLAGAGSALNQQIGLPPLYGSVFMAILSLATVMFGLGGIVSALSFLVPVIFVGIIILTFIVLAIFPISLAEIRYYAQPWKAVLPFWPLSATTYVSYNLIVAVAILAPMGRMARETSVIEKGSLWGAAGLGIGITAINIILLSVPNSFQYPIPMNYVANLLSSAVGSGYTIILLASIYTTAAGGLYGFCSRIANPAYTRFKIMVVVIAAAGVLASFAGFTKLVRYLYSGIGIAGFLLLGSLAYEHLKTRIKV